MNLTMEASKCIALKNLTESQTLSSARYWCEIGLLASFNVFVVVGNCLVLFALAIDRQLRTPTHYFIGSLAIADLALGLFVLPFATDLHIRGFWTFGSLFCQIWLAFDVWLCTASIYSLIAVTFDRYVAVTKPLTYKLVMTRRKASILIVVVWTAALVICLPAFAFSLHRTYRLSSVTCQCTQMAHSPVYIAYSSTGSFYLPMVIIMYLYTRIYATVRKIRLSGSTGIVSMAKSAMSNAVATAACPAKLTNGHASLLDKGPQLSGTLRVHKGKYKPAQCGRSKNGLVQRIHRFSLTRKQNRKSAEEAEMETTPLDDRHEIVIINDYSPGDQQGSPITPRTRNRMFEDNANMNFLTPSTAPSCPSSSSNSPRGSMSETRFIEQQINAAASHSVTASGGMNPASAAADLWLHIIMPSQLTSLWCQRMTVFQKYQKKFTLELKALKTVGIVTGCFFACWLGFCIVYTMQALPYCRVYNTWEIFTFPNMIGNATQYSFEAVTSNFRIGNCVPDWITNLMMWLGYVNSAMNPIIYGVSNKQFRKTFKNILRCNFTLKRNSLRMRTKSNAGAQQKRSQMILGDFAVIQD